MEDSYKHKGLRRQLIDAIRRKGIKDERVLEAMDKIPRHLFFDSSFLKFAYEDKPFPIGEGQTISQPYTVAFMTELLNVQKGEKVLEVGTGSGYQACIIEELGGRVYTVERHKALYQKAKKNAEKLSYRIKVFYGDGYKGLPTYGPFDKIIVTAGSEGTPQALIDQLKPGGRMVIPIGSSDLQHMITLDKSQEGEIIEKSWGGFRFVPLLPGKDED
ncbi:MAG: protein-L-isoaspartate(D-aspartate) O-methyltransferase [Bacteroidales bacterium]|nr:protein-L-isoaspartate(D-aspartate) O-methyltransferase [Bacteroidales bacterium]